MINIVNKKNHKEQANDVYIGRPSILDNPYEMKLYGRERCIELFEKEFYQCLTTGKDTKNMVYTQIQAALDNIVAVISKFGSVNLVCWCAPLACHGSVIAEYIVKMDLAIDTEATSAENEDLLSSGLIQPEDI